MTVEQTGQPEEQQKGNKRGEGLDSEYYLLPNDFFREILSSLIDGEPSDSLVGMFILLSERTANHRYFVGYPHLRQDIISTAQLACLKAFDSFRPYKDKQASMEWAQDPYVFDYDYRVCNSAFAFFTTCIMNDVFRFMKEEYNHRNAVNATRVQQGMDPDYGYAEMEKGREDKAKVAAAAEPDDLDADDEFTDEDEDEDSGDR